MQIEFEIENQRLTLTSEAYIVAKSLQFIYAHFDFTTDDWQGLDHKKGLFNCNNNTHEMDINEAGICQVPYECTMEDGEFTVGVIGYNNDGNTIGTASTKVLITREGGIDGLLENEQRLTVTYLGTVLAAVGSAETEVEKDRAEVATNTVSVATMKADVADMQEDVTTKLQTASKTLTDLTAANLEGQQIITDIGTEKITAVKAVTDTKTAAVSTVNDTKDTAVAAVNSAKTIGVAAVQTQQAASVNAVVAQENTSMAALQDLVTTANAAASTATVKADEASTSASNASASAGVANAAASTATVKAGETVTNATTANEQAIIATNQATAAATSAASALENATACQDIVDDAANAINLAMGTVVVNGLLCCVYESEE